MGVSYLEELIRVEKADGGMGTAFVKFGSKTHSNETFSSFSKE